MEFPEWVVKRVMGRQGCLHPTQSLVPSRTAFVVVDLQNFFTQPGYMGECPAARTIFPAVNRLAAALRAAGGHVIWIQTCADGAEHRWKHFHDRLLTAEKRSRRLTELAAAHQGFQLAEGLDVAEEDARIVKTFYSALGFDSSALGAELEARGVETVLIGGTATNVCCESTARSAMMMDYPTIMVHDALAAYSQAEHEWTLQNWMLFFGDVLGVSELIDRFERAPA